MRSSVLTLIVLLSLTSNATPASAESTPRYSVAHVVEIQTDQVTDSPVGSCDGLRGTINDINDKGEVVGFLPKDDTRGNAFVWNGEKLTRLKSGRGGAVGLAINNTGTIVGISFTRAREDECDIGQNPVPAQWVDGKYSLLDLPEGADQGHARDVNEDGLIVGDIKLASETEATLPVVWQNGLVKQLSVQIPSDSPTWEYSSSGIFRSASVTSVDGDGKLYGWGYVIDDQGVRPWQFPLVWPDADSDPIVVGNLGYTINLAGAGTIPLGTFADSDYNVFGIQYRDDSPITLPWPDVEGDIYGLDISGSDAEDQIILGNYSSLTAGFGPAIWDLRSGDPAAIAVYDLRSITDGQDELAFEVGIDINASGQLLVQARNDDGVRFFLILEPTGT